MDHPYICKIYEIGEAQKKSFIAMEYIQGANLREKLEENPLPVRKALETAGEIAEALETAHKQKIVHRDLKPSNIMLTPAGHVKVMDFGLAKELTSLEGQEEEITTALTKDGSLLGTLPNMSPEQVLGRRVDTRSDIFSFGVVLYEMLTGVNPFKGDTSVDTAHAILNKTAPPLTRYTENIPVLLQHTVKKTLAKEPDRRYQLIHEVRTDLGELIEESGDSISEVAAAPSEATSAVGKWGQPIPLVTALLVGSTLAGLAVWNLKPTPETATPFTAQTVAIRLTNYGGGETSPALAPDGRSLVFVSDHGGAPDIWLRQVSGGDLVQLTDDAAVESDLVYASDGDTIYFSRSDNSGRAIWRIGALGGEPRLVVSNAHQPAPSPGGQSLAYRSGGAIVLSAVDGSGSRTLVQAVGSEARPAWAPDGRRLSYHQHALFAPSNLVVIDVETGQIHQVTHFVTAGEGIKSHVWLPDNRHLAVSYFKGSSLWQNDLGILDVEDGSVSRLTLNVEQSFAALSVSADGSRLVVTASQVHREVWKVPLGPDPEANGRAAVRVLDRSHDPMWTFVSRDGRTLLFNNATTGSRNLWTMPLDHAAEPRQITTVPGDAVMHSSLSPAGTRVAFASRATGNSDIWTQNLDGSGLRQLTNDAAADSWPVWSPDGEWIVFSSFVDDRYETRRVPAAGGPAEKVVDGFFRGDWIDQPDGSGTWLVTSTSGRESSVRLTDFEKRTVLWNERMDWDSNWWSLPMFSPDGRFISMPLQERCDSDVIWILDASTGQRRLGVRFPEPFRMYFRADWVDDGEALLVNHYETTSHVVLLDSFWVSEGR